MQQSTSQAEENKQIVRDCYELAFNQRNPQEAAARYMGETYIQHNPLAGDGEQAFIAGLTYILGANPEYKVSIKRMVAEGDLVVIHSHHTPTPGQRGRAVMDIFRLANGKIVEHWDASQEVPETAANTNTMF